MKKTFFLTILLTGLISSSQGATLLTAWDSFNGTTNGTYTLAGSSTFSDGVLHLPAAARPTDVKMTSSTGNNAFSHTGASNRIESVITLTLGGLTLPVSGTAILFECSDPSRPTSRLGLGVNSQGNLVGLYNGGTSAGKYFALDMTQKVTLTLATNDTGTTLYANGEKLGVLSTELKTSSANGFTTMHLGGNAATSGSLKGAQFDVYNFYAHGGTMTDKEVKDFYNSTVNIPEPSTATLGLLGLAGLLMRRRRTA